MVFTNLPAELSSVQLLLTPGLEVSSVGSAYSEEVHHPTMSCSAECECSYNEMPESLSRRSAGRPGMCRDIYDELCH